MHEPSQSWKQEQRAGERPREREREREREQGRERQRGSSLDECEKAAERVQWRRERVAKYTTVEE